MEHVGRSELLGALSHALDMTQGQSPGHGLRCGWIGLHVGRAAGLKAAELTPLHDVLLMKDLGCSSNAARICELYLTDDRTFKHDHKLVGDSLPAALRFVLTHTGLQAGLAERVRAMVAVLRDGGRIAGELIETRCRRGAAIARRMGFPEEVARGIAELDEHWDGGGRPVGLAGRGISPHARIALLAQVADVFHTAAGAEAARREVGHRCGTWFDPDLVVAFEAAAAGPGFWEGLRAEGLPARLHAMVPARADEVVDEDGLDDVALAFAEVVDAKSPFTRGHSERVALYADVVAAELGMPAEPRRRLRRAALLHDIGKLGVSNEILDKPGKLDAAEWTAMRRHPELGAAILARVGAFGDLVEIAGAHHERLDGGGYPGGLTAPRIALPTRIVSVADVFDALTADRPYRAAMPRAKALGIMEAEVGAAFDPDCFAALCGGLERMERAAA